jgi:hypothetical protein
LFFDHHSYDAGRHPSNKLGVASLAGANGSVGE